MYPAIKSAKFQNRMLNKMFQIVGFDKFDKAFTEQEFWYQKKNWTKIQEENFKKYYIREYMKTFNTTKKEAAISFGWFNLAWGWKSEENC